MTALLANSQGGPARMASIVSLTVTTLLVLQAEGAHQVRLISHRGNLFHRAHLGVEENSPKRLLEALSHGLDVELDVRLVAAAEVAAAPHLAHAAPGLVWALGHDEAQFAVPLSMLQNPRVWVHAKNHEALSALVALPLHERPHFFWHDVDEYTLTSKGVVWIYPDRPLPGNGSDAVAVMFKEEGLEELVRSSSLLGVCSDTVLALREALGPQRAPLAHEKVPTPAALPAALSPASTMVKLVVFDLDGVLVESRDMHFTALNLALSALNDDGSVLESAPRTSPGRWELAYSEHLSTYDGLSTMQKLRMLSRPPSEGGKGLPNDPALHDAINARKQRHTLERRFPRNNFLVALFATLKARGFRLAVVSNCVRTSVRSILADLGLLDLTDLFLSNEDVAGRKPAPVPYLAAMSLFGVGKRETLIVEDSQRGRISAVLSGAHHLLLVNGPSEVTPASISAALATASQTNARRAIDRERGVVQIMVPMAGAGSRFAKAGYTSIKPMIDVQGKRMIERVVENLRPTRHEFRFMFVVQHQHRADSRNDMDAVLVQRATRYAPRTAIVEVDGLTEGAAVTALAARGLIDNEAPLLIANSDQYIDWGEGRSVDDFIDCLSTSFPTESGTEIPDGCIATFPMPRRDSKWSYAALDPHGWVGRVAEKDPISTHATCGIYLWRKGSDFVAAADAMIAKDIRTNGEFYIAPSLNELLPPNAHGMLRTWDVGKMWGLGVPEDLDFFLSQHSEIGFPRHSLPPLSFLSSLSLKPKLHDDAAAIHGSACEPLRMALSARFVSNGFSAKIMVHIARRMINGTASRGVAMIPNETEDHTALLAALDEVCDRLCLRVLASMDSVSKNGATKLNIGTTSPTRSSFDAGCVTWLELRNTDSLTVELPAVVSPATLASAATIIYEVEAELLVKPELALVPFCAPLRSRAFVRGYSGKEDAFAALTASTHGGGAALRTKTINDDAAGENIAEVASDGTVDSLKRSESLNVALCVAGEARTFREETVWRSQRRFVLDELSRQVAASSAGGVVDVFVVIGAADVDDGALLRLIYEVLEPVAVVHSPVLSNNLQQFERFATCKALMAAHSASTGTEYDWAVRIRPDLYFYAALPPLASLDSSAVHARMRCFHWPSGMSFTEEHISAENQHLLRDACGSAPSSCNCLQRGCPTERSKRMDDQAAIVPGNLIDAYFANHGGLEPWTGLHPLTADVHCPCGALTAGVLASGARVEPLDLRFGIARFGPHHGANALLSNEVKGLICDAPVEAAGGDKCDLGAVLYECVNMN